MDFHKVEFLDARVLLCIGFNVLPTVAQGSNAQFQLLDAGSMFEAALGAKIVYDFSSLG